MPTGTGNELTGHIHWLSRMSRWAAWSEEDRDAKTAETSDERAAALAVYEAEQKKK